MDLQPTLTGQYVRLRPLREEDRAALYAAASDPAIWEQHPSKRNEKSVFDPFFDDALRSKGALLVTDAETGNVIGTSRYYDWNAQKKSVVIGYTFLARPYWGRGHNREMKALMLEHAFRSAENVFFHIAGSNLRSQRAIEGIGAEMDEIVEDACPDGSAKLIYKIGREG